jgi:hypothetical protein
MTPFELGEVSNKSLHLLEHEFIRDGVIPVDQLQKAFIYLHVRTISGLMDDILFLESYPKTTVARCAVRPMMESLFNMGAAIRDESFVFNKVAWEIDRWISIQESMAEETHIATDAEKLKKLAANGKVELTEFRKTHTVDKLENWNQIYKIAEIAKLKKVYDHYYSLACHHVHSNLVGILSYDSTSRGMTMRSATMIVAWAIQFAGSYINPSKREDYDKLAGGYIAILEKLSVDGSYE